MIRYVRLKNYKSLVDLTVDFMKTKINPKNMILIYGENGIGKSNFANSFYTLNETMRTMSSNIILKKFFESKESLSIEQLSLVEKFAVRDIKMIIKDCKTIGSKENMLIEFGFSFHEKNGIYCIEMNDEEIVSERLDYVVNKNQTNFFDITSKFNKINSSIFTNKKYYNDFNILLDKYWGKHSLLSILFYEMEDKKKEYIKKNISENFYEVLMYLSSISTKIKGSKVEYGTIDFSYLIGVNLDEGKISKKDEQELNKYEQLCNEIFTTLYSDIKSVYYKKEIEDNNIKYNMFCKKEIYGKLVDVDFSFESTGTQNILKIIPYLISACDGKTVIVDEIDTGIHDLLVKNLLECVQKYINGQLILTTHNTMLIDSSIPNESIYVFNANSKAEKELVAITDFDERIHKNNNPRKKYLNGMYGGVPMFTDIDFEELLDILD